jgi:hypothetical protein
MDFVVPAIVFSVLIIMGIELATIMPSESLYAYDTTTNQLPTQSNTANGDNNRLQNCGQTAAGRHNGQSLECQQNGVNEAIDDDEDTKGGIGVLTVFKVVDCGGFIIFCLNPSSFTIHVEGNNPSPSSFAGSLAGTTVLMSKGEYSVTETMPVLPRIWPPGTEIKSHLSPDCNG